MKTTFNENNGARLQDAFDRFAALAGRERAELPAEVIAGAMVAAAAALVLHGVDLADQPLVACELCHIIFDTLVDGPPKTLVH